jgi:hypothetical protein
LDLHRQNITDGIGWSEFKQKIKEKYGF